MSLGRLARLRALRETVARARLGAAREASRESERDRDAAEAEAERIEGSLDERGRRAVHAFLASRADGLRLARLSLQYRLGQEELSAARDVAATLAEKAQREAEAAERSRLHWSARAKGLRKATLLRDSTAPRHHIED